MPVPYTPHQHSLGRYTRIVSGLLACCLAFHAGQATAAALESGYPTEVDLLGQLPVVLTAARLSQRVNTSAVPITVIDRQMIKASGARELEDIFRLVPGMIVGHDNGGTAFVTYHAMANRFAHRLQVLIDGRSVYSPIFGEVDWASLPVAINDIQRIEVIRSPAAASYGANAFLAAINIITRKASQEQGGKTELAAGSDGINRLYARYGGGTGSASWRVTGTTWGDHGFQNSPINETDDKQTNVINGRLDLLQNELDHWSFQFGITNGRRTVGDTAHVNYMPHSRNVFGDFEQLHWQHGNDPDNNIAINFYHQDTKMSERYQSGPISLLGGQMVPLSLDADGDRYNLELQQAYSPATNVRTVWGAGTRIDKVTSYPYLNTSSPHSNHEYRLFSHVEWTLGARFITNAGAMLEHAQLGGTTFSPAIALNYLASPGHTFRIGINTAYRYPVQIEELGNQRYSSGPVFDQVIKSSGGLEPEHIVSYDIGYVGEVFNHNFWTDARLFYDKINNLITYYQIPYPDSVGNGALDFRNLDSLTAKGAEFQLNYRMGDSARLVVNYAFTILSGMDIDESYSKSGPKHNFSLLFLHNLKNDVTTSIGFYFMSHMDGLDTGTPVPAQKRLDLRVSAPLGPGFRGARVSFVLQSVLGEYQDYRNVNLFAPRIYVDLSVPF